MVLEAAEPEIKAPPPVTENDILLTNHSLKELFGETKREDNEEVILSSKVNLCLFSKKCLLPLDLKENLTHSLSFL